MSREMNVVRDHFHEAVQKYANATKKSERDHCVLFMERKSGELVIAAIETRIIVDGMKVSGLDDEAAMILRVKDSKGIKVVHIDSRGQVSLQLLIIVGAVAQNPEMN